MTRRIRQLSVFALVTQSYVLIDLIHSQPRYIPTILVFHRQRLLTKHARFGVQHAAHLDVALPSPNIIAGPSLRTLTTVGGTVVAELRGYAVEIITIFKR